MITIIIDRVGKTNIFNIIQDKSLSTPVLNINESFQSDIDNDLIEEFQEEINRIANISKSLSNLPQGNEENQALIFQHLNLSSRLKDVGQIFFRQFFPIALQKFFKESQDFHLFFHVDPKLSSIPIEILHDGEHFFLEKFYLSKSIKGRTAALKKAQSKEKLNMLIVADPTEDLEWARQEGEKLFEVLSAKYPENKLKIELLGGRKVTKLNLLNAVLNKDIIHYSGHLKYSDSENENGWVLFDNKIFQAREFQQSGSEPMLIFSNSCISGMENNSLSNESFNYADFASSFLNTPTTNYIGTNWELPDTQQTLEFTINFYEHLLQGTSIGKSLQKARIYARENFPLNDLTWASYLLIGNPASLIFELEEKTPDITHSIIDTKLILQYYPFPIANAYLKFQNYSEQNSVNKRRLFQLLIDLFEELILFFSAVIFSNYKYLKISHPIEFNSHDLDSLLDNTFKALNTIKSLNIKTVIPKLLGTFFVHKDSFYKIAKWKRDFENNKISNDNLESYTVTVQYLVEGFILDIDYIKNYGFYRIVEPGHKQLNFLGISEYHKIKEIILPTQTNKSTHLELLQKTEKLVGKTVFYNPIKKIFLDLSDYLDIDTSDENSYKLIYK